MEPELPPFSDAPADEIKAIAQYMSSMHDGKPIRIWQRHATAALLDLAEYIAVVRGHRTPADLLRYIHAISRMQDQGIITVEEVWDLNRLPGEPKSYGTSFTVVTLSTETLGEALR